VTRRAVVTAAEYRRLADTEAALQASVEQEAKRWGWRRFHVEIPQKSAPGFPDLVLVRPPRVIVSELKGPRGVISDDQQAWHDDLRACPGIEFYLWTFAEWDSGEIVRLLR
jgi:hypothetical protein